MVPAYDPDAYDLTLWADDYADALPTLVDEALAHASDVYLCLEPKWLEEPPDGEACRRTWRRVSGAFDPVTGVWDDAHPQYRGPLPAAESGFRELLSHLDGIAGPHFLRFVMLADGDDQLLYALPHDSGANVASGAFSGEFRSAVADAFQGRAACLVDAGTHESWVAGDREYSLRGSSLCAATLDGKRTVCYGLAGVTATAVDGDELCLQWGSPPDDDAGLVDRAVRTARSGAAGPPERIPCGDRETAERVRDRIAELLDRYDGRSV